MPNDIVEELAGCLVLGELLSRVRERWGAFRLLDHFKQGEFHHDVLIELPEGSGLQDRILVVSTNCNGGVKEVLLLREPPTAGGLWRARCPENSEFEGPLPEITARARTIHWFDPCELLTADARSEYRPEYRERQCGGGWVARPRAA
ncbi:MAG TPA: hypothetical protein VFQ61_00725 [Polyangiaceae bacterium]|nr:hypothetical protein [Polyangiaceae bacterium]